MPLPIPTYDTTRAYDENFASGPTYSGPFPALPEPKELYSFLGFRLASPIGIPAGPLLNSAYIDLYGKLGWDVPVYKTVRSIPRACHPAPNYRYAARFPGPRR